MSIKNIIITAFRALMTHRSRSGLTILGIVIGISAIIIVMALGNGAQKLILDQISGLGAESIVLRPGKGFSNMPTSLFSQSLKAKDVEALRKKSNVPNLSSLAAFIMIPYHIEYRGEKYNPTIFGGSAEFMGRVYSMSTKEGKFYTQDDIDRYTRVAVIGSKIRDELFDNQEAIGRSINIKDQRFRVVGVFDDKGSVGGFNFDEMVMIPETTAQRYITGTDYFMEIIILADDVKNVDKMVLDISNTLRETHDLSSGDESDFYIQTQKNLVKQIGLITSIFTSFLSAVVAISLIVGGVGIMNIMLVSVTERTKEIGLRKALGARRQDILRQFLFEAVILTSIGGLIGIVLGTLIALVVSLILSFTVVSGWTFTFPFWGAVLGLFVSSGIGLIFGIYPANQAAKKSPIEALQYE